MTKLRYYTIRTQAYGKGPWLLIDDECDDGIADDRMTEARTLLRKTTQRGRLPMSPMELPMRAELEGETEHYSDDEIAVSLQGTPIPYDWRSGEVLCDERFLSALEAGGAGFVARPVQLVHRATARTFPEFWLVRYTERRALRLLRDDSEPVFTGTDLSAYSGGYYNERLKERLEALGWSWLHFTKHELEPCTSVPIGDGPDADRQILEATRRAFLTKSPPVEPGSGYGTDWLVEELSLRYSDITNKRLESALRGEGATEFIIKLTAGGDLDSVGVRTDCPLGERLAAKRATR